MDNPSGWIFNSVQDIETDETENEIISRPVSPISQKLQIIRNEPIPSDIDLERFEHFMNTIKGMISSMAITISQ